MKNSIFLIPLVIILGCASSTPKATTESAKTALKKADEKEKLTETAKAGAGKAEAKAKEAGEKAEKTVETADKVTCKSGAEERSIAKRSVEGGGCEVVYTKGGEEKVIATAKADLGYCDKAHEKLKANLETAGFKCE